MALTKTRLSVVIALQSLVGEFRSRLNLFYQTEGQGIAPELQYRLTDSEIEEWAKLKVDDQLNAFLEWADCPLSAARDYLKSKLQWYTDHPHVALLRCRLHESMLDDIVQRYIYSPIAENIGETWSIWNTTEMPSGDLFLEEGMDYRIHEWYRLTGKEIPE